MTEVKVAALQFDVRRGEVERNLAHVESGLRAAARDGVGLVVLPEMWPTSFVELEEDGADEVARTEEALSRVASLSAELELVVCGSAFAAAGAGERPRNRLRVFDRGETALTFDKLHLFSPTGERESFSAGEDPPATVETSVGRLSGVVCYDLRFGPLTGVPFRDGAEILVVPAQWPETRATHWRALVLGRAVENQCFVVACNRIGTDLVGRRRLELSFPGNSIVADPAGRVRAEGRGEDGLVTAAIDLDEVRALRSQVPVARDRRDDLYGDWG
ncbi:MAG: carbon-nitrogen family hydrolase [Planctomycetota bacterium]|nr:carbon-nitrogen family hydrolase [Planctomycetota bacterium]